MRGSIAQVTSRARAGDGPGSAGARSVDNRGRPSCSWNTCHDAVAEKADPVLDAEPAPVRVLSIDETHGGKVKYEKCQERASESGSIGSTPCGST